MQFENAIYILTGSCCQIILIGSLSIHYSALLAVGAVSSREAFQSIESSSVDRFDISLFVNKVKYIQTNAQKNKVCQEKNNCNILSTL